MCAGSGVGGGEEGTAGSGHAGRSWVLTCPGREDAVGGMSAPQVLPVADDSLLSSSSTS